MVTRRSTAVVILVLLLVSACGGGDSDDDTSTGPGERFGTVADESASTTVAAATSTTAGGASAQPPALVRPASVTASATAPPGQDAAGNTVTYDATKLIDGNPSTAWRVAGDGRGVVITLRFSQPVRVASIGFVNGYAKVDAADGTDRFRQNRRVLRVRVGAAGDSQELNLADSRDLQRLPLQRGPVSELLVEILDSTSNPERDFTALSEIEVQGTPAA